MLGEQKRIGLYTIQYSIIFITQFMLCVSFLLFL